MRKEDEEELSCFPHAQEPQQWAALQGRRCCGRVGMVIVDMMSTVAFLCSLRYGGELFQIFPNLQPVRVLSDPRASVLYSCCEFLSHDTSYGFGVHHSHKQNARNEAAPGLQACLSVLTHRSNDAFGFVLLFSQAQFMAQKLVFCFTDTEQRTASCLLFSISLVESW